jgi:hypothetical protein
MWQTEVPSDSHPIGYRALVDLFQLEVPPHFRWSYTSTKWEKREIKFDDQNLTLYIYPPDYQIDKDPFKHLEFAIKHEGINLLILKKVFQQLPAIDLAHYIENRPTSKYARLLWFLYEYLLDKKLDLPDVKRGSYIPVLDPEKYFVAKSQRIARYRVENNLLGSLEFCPVVRKTNLLQEYEAKKLNRLALELVQKYNQDILSRAMLYLYTKETLSSWEIEREKPSQSRLVKFTNLLRKADSLGALSKESLIELQKEIVDARFALKGYRDFQNYIGEEPRLDQLILHYISPRSEDVEKLMAGLLFCFERMVSSQCPAVIDAAVLAFGLVFIHPFWDGNGRLHRFLIHYALSQCGFTPKEVVFPVSVVILREPRRYDKALEIFSKPLMELIHDYTINDAGEMKVTQDTYDLYQFMDLTPQAEYLFECVEKTIITDFEQELRFLVTYDKIKKEIKELIDIPDQQFDLFIKCVRQNGGRLSAKKREAYFSMLTPNEIQQMEAIIESNQI